MSRTIVSYGLILAITAFLLTWIDYKFWLRDIGLEVYGLVIAVLFGGLGVWIERQRSKGTVEPHPAPNHKAIEQLGLTERELEILDHLTLGKSNKQIARDLHLSPNTIKTHLTNLYDKLGAKNRTQAVIKANELSIKSIGETRETS